MKQTILTNLLYFVKGLAIIVAIIAPINGLIYLALWVDPRIAGAVMLAMLAGFGLYCCWLVGYIISQKAIR